jgi:hypothetical protein
MQYASAISNARSHCNQECLSAYVRRLFLSLPIDKKDEKLCSKKSGFDPRTFGSVTDERAPKLDPPSLLHTYSSCISLKSILNPSSKRP